MLKFEVSNQTITRVDKFTPASNSFNYLEAEFTFKTDDWNDCTKTAIFEVNGLPYKAEIENNKCKVSNKALAIDYQLSKCDIRVSVVGERSNYRITTNIKIIQLNKTLYRPQIPNDTDNPSIIPPGGAITVDTKLSPDSSNAIANSAVTKVLDGGKLLGFEVITNYADYSNFEEHSSKYTEGLTNGGYVVLLVTDMVYKDDNIADESQFLLAQGTYILKDMDVILQGVGIEVINELIDELDTRYLSNDEWEKTRDFLWSAIQIISDSVTNTNDRIDALEGYSVTLANNSVNVVSDNTEYTGANISKLAIEYPDGDFECYISLTFAQEGDITVTLPESKYIGKPPVFANGEHWELSIKNGVVVGGKAE